MTWVAIGYRKAHAALVAAVLILAALTLPARGSEAQANVITVAASTDMEPILQVLGPIFEKKTGQKLKISFDSSSTFAQQLQHDSSTDIFFSSDYFYAEQLVASNLSETRQPTPYAKGMLVLWARNGSRFKPLSLDDLSRKDLKSVAVPDSSRAPYGRAGIAALKRMKLWDNVAPHIVQAQSADQAAQFVLDGTAELALISQTVAMSAKYRSQGNFVLFPTSQYPDIQQCAVILKNGHNREGAHALLKFILSDEVQNNLPKLGLRPVQ